MANVLIESKGKLISLKNDIKGFISLQEADNFYEFNCRGKKLNFRIKNNHLYNFGFNKDVVLPKLFFMQLAEISP